MPAKPIPFDWSVSSVEQRQALFAVCNEIRKQEHWTWPRFLKEAGATGPVSKDYEQNFRRGRIHKRKAAQLYEWIAERRPLRARELHAALKREDQKSQNIPTGAEAYRKVLFDRPWGWDDPDPPAPKQTRRKSKPKR